MSMDRKSVEQIIEAIGGAENIEAVTHCVTRLRFVLRDDSKVDEAALESNSLVKGHFNTQGQYQVIIGPGLVNKVYEELVQLTGAEQVSKNDVKDLATNKQNPLQRAIKTLADIFIPILPAIVTAGLLLGINNILTGPGIFFDGVSLVEVYPQWQDFASIANTAFTFLPALIGWSAVVRFGGSPLLGIVLGLVLVHPDLLSAYSYAEAKTNGTVPVWNLFGWEIEKIGYQGQVLPVLVSAYILAKIESFMNKKVAYSFKLLVVAPVALLITSFLAFTVIGPITFAIGNAITSGLVYVFDAAPAVGGLIYGGLYPLLVITGMHHTFLAVDVQLIGSQGGTFLWPMLALSNIAQGAAALAMMFVFKQQKSKGLAVTSSISAFLGVTEPAIFGVNVRHKYPFVFGMIGSAAAGVLLTMNHVQAASIGVGGIPGFLSIFPNQWGVFFLGMAIVLLVPFITTVIYGKVKGDKSVDAGRTVEANDCNVNEVAIPQHEPVQSSEQEAPAQDESTTSVVEIHAPMFGQAVALEQVPDPAFSSGAMGQGIAVEPEEGKVVAPFDGVVAHVIDSKHAVILEHKTGVQVLIHVGINTVSLKGNGFTSHVKTGDQVQAGQLLLEFDRDVITQAGYPTITPIIVPDGQDQIERVEVMDAVRLQNNKEVIFRVHIKK